MSEAGDEHSEISSGQSSPVEFNPKRINVVTVTRTIEQEKNSLSGKWRYIQICLDIGILAVFLISIAIVTALAFRSGYMDSSLPHIVDEILGTVRMMEQELAEMNTKIDGITKLVMRLQEVDQATYT